MFNQSGPEITRIDGRSLKVSCAPAFKGLQYHLPGIAMLAFIAVKNWRTTGVFEGIMLTLMFLALAALIYRNTLHRDDISIFKDGTCLEPARFAFTCAEINSVEVEAEAGWMSYQWRMADAGLGRGLIVIHAVSETYHFGVGLSESQARAVAREISAFCEHCKQQTETLVSD